MKTKSILRVLFAVSIFVFLPLIALSQAAVENRSALLIANGEYKNFGWLQNPVPEARALKATLESLGFEVRLVENADRETILNELAAFEGRLREKKGTAFFHYGGHAVQVSGKNYLIPAPAEIPDERRVSTRAVDLDEVMASLIAAGSDTNIVVLDACRNNPLPSSSGRSATRGLDVLGTKPKNSVVVYAAEANTEALDGIFTPALIKHLKTPGLSLSEVLQNVRREVYEKSGGMQTPGEYNQLFTPVYLAGQKKALSASESSIGKSQTVSSSAPLSPAQASATAELVVSADQDGAEIWLDGKLLGLAPNLFSGIPAGREIQLEAKKGFMFAAERLTLNGNETREVAFRMERRKGNIFFQVPNAASFRLWLEGQEFGPLSAAGLAKDIGEGEREAELRGEGMYWKGKIEVKSGVSTSVKADPWDVGSLSLEAPPETNIQLIQTTSGDAKTEPLSIRGKGGKYIDLLPVGSYTAEASGEGYNKVSEIVIVEKGRVTRWKPWKTGILVVTTEPPGASISIDGVERSKSPLTLEVYEAGNIIISAVSEGYGDKKQSALIEAGKTTAINWVLEKQTIRIGAKYAGGIIFYLNGKGGGLVAAPSDQSAGIPLGEYDSNFMMGTNLMLTAPEIGSGKENTRKIVSKQNTGHWAAELCENLVLDGYDDWFLPSKDELSLMYKNLRAAGIGSFAAAWYWSSSDFTKFQSWIQNFGNGGQAYDSKSRSFYVRAVRAF